MKFKRRVFRDPAMQRIYDLMLELGDPSRGGSGHAHAFWLGYRELLTPQHTYPRNTLAYAAWAAGRDRRAADAVPATGELA